MAPAGLYIGALLAAAAVGLIAVFAIAGAAVLVIGPQRQRALTAPMAAATLAGLSALFFGSELRLDAAAILGITALSAVVVTTFQRLREAPPDSTAQAIGIVGGQACIGAAQGLVFGAAVSIVGHDPRLLWILLPTGAVIRGAWAFHGRNRSATVGPAPIPEPETGPDLTAANPASTGFTPDSYTIEVHSACGAWDIQLTPD
jgi:hypothetical protein